MLRYCGIYRTIFCIFTQLCPQQHFSDGEGANLHLTCGLACVQIVQMSLPIQAMQHYLSRAIVRRRLAHAILLVGDNDAEKKAVAQYLAMLLICDKITLLKGILVPCEVCTDCISILHLRHTNVEWMTPISSDEIRIGQVRELKEHLCLSSFNDKPRLVILDKANSITTQAANALLKSVEEPGADQYFLFLARSSTALVPTLVSRCQKLVMPHSAREGEQHQDDMTVFASSVLERLRTTNLGSRITLIDELMKHPAPKLEILIQLRELVHSELRTQPDQFPTRKRADVLTLLESLERSCHLLSANVNPQLTFEALFLKEWPTI